MRLAALVASFLLLGISRAAEIPGGVQHVGDNGPGQGKHIVLLAGDHEYPAANHLPGAAMLKEADLMIVFLRFKDFPDEQMRHIEYLNQGGPILGD